MALEQWKDIKGYEGLYQVSDLGRVRSLDRDWLHRGIVKKRKGKVLSANENTSGYPAVALWRNKHKESILVHRLVAQEFLEDYSADLQVNHINLIKSDNRLDNLEMCTRLENMIHMTKHGRVGTQKLKPSQVHEIRERVSNGENHRMIAKDFDISRTVITRIGNRTRWSHLEERSN